MSSECRSSAEAGDDDIVLAGGGVLFSSKEGYVEDLSQLKKSQRLIAVVHRPTQDDWSFPKGKLDPGETLEECALREVLEESGIKAELDTRLADVHYRDRRGRPKIVAYWTMRAISGEFCVNSETDELRWLRPKRVSEILTYDADKIVLANALEALD